MRLVFGMFSLIFKKQGDADDEIVKMKTATALYRILLGMDERV